MASVRLLGPVEVVDDTGTVRSPGSPRRRTLLALLALRAGQVVSSDWLLEHAWSGEPPESRNGALRFHISQLRKELGAAALVETCPGGYRLTLAPEHVDALALEVRHRAAQGATDHGTAADVYAWMHAAWRGEPFVDAAWCADLDREAERLDELRVAVTEAYLRSRLDAGAGRELIADLATATTQHPLRESFWAMLITAQYRAGRQADALRSYEQLRQLLADSLGLDPSSELRDLHLRVLQHDPSLTAERPTSLPIEHVNGGPPRRRHSLPTPATALIDAGDRLGAVRALLRRHRLITLTGAGGVGKTRLAVELGWSALDDFAGGAWFIELAPVPHGDAVLATVASDLAIRPQEGMTLAESIVDWLTGREILLILDNCEHVVTAVGALVSTVVARCPTVKVVATSRESLGVGGERVHRVDTLDPAVDGLALFVDRASAADSSFAMTDLEHSAVTQICRRLDGLPLAIEMAAARVRSMAPRELLERLDDPLVLLRGRAGVGVDHHETLRATVEWSYRLLTDDERTFFDRLAVFAGTFDLRAAEVVCADETLRPAGIAQLLANLVDKSMVVAERHAETTRFRVLEPLRQFAASKLIAAGGMAAARARHLEHYVTVVEDADARYRSADQVIGAATIDREWDNVRAAHESAIDARALTQAERLIHSTWHYAYSLLRFEHREWVERTIALGTADRLPSPDTFAQASFWAGEPDESARQAELIARGLDAAGTWGDPSAALCLACDWDPDHYRALEALVPQLDLDREWSVLLHLADGAPYFPTPDGDRHIARLVETAERVRAPFLMAVADSTRSSHVLFGVPPDFATSLTLATRALDTARRAGMPVEEGDAVRAVALAKVGLGLPDAADACREALSHCYEIRYWWRVWHVLESTALVLATTGRTESAAVVLGHLEAHRPPFGNEHNVGFRDRALDIVRRDVDADEWMARGAGMDAHEIVQTALAALEGS